MSKADYCVDCVYYKRETGRCLRYPPAFNGEDKNGEPYYGWPLVRPDHWCGEFKRDEAEFIITDSSEILTEPEPQPEEKSILDKGKEFFKSFSSDGKKEK